MKVYFENSYGEERQIGTAKNEEEANVIIKNFLNKNNYKSNYTISTICPDGRKKIDVGSWSEFFYIEY